MGFIACFLRKAQLVSKIGSSCTFSENSVTHIGKNQSCIFLGKSATRTKKVLIAYIFEKSATCIEKKSKLHISREKCNPYGKLVGSCTFLEKSATHIIKHLTVTNFFEKNNYTYFLSEKVVI
jgi:hypothetical protein